MGTGVRGRARAGDASRATAQRPTRGGARALRLADAHGYPYTIIRIVDVADPAHPVQVGAYTSSIGEYVDLAVQDRYAYLAHGGYTQIDTIDVANPMSPAFVGAGPAYVGGAYLSVAGAHGYVTYTRDVIVLHTLDMSDPAHPVELGSARASIGPEATTRPVVVAGYAYVPVASGILVFDARDPAHPALVRRYVVAGSPYYATPALAVAPPGWNSSRTYGYYTNQATLHVVDLTDPTNPVEVRSAAAPGGTWWAAQVAGSTLYGASDGGLQVLSLAEPSRPALVGAYPGAVYDVALAGSTSYLAAGAEGLKVVDVANPDQPRRLGTFLLSELRLPLVPQNAGA